MAQHFLLSAKARTLSIGAVTRMSDDQVEATFKAIRWAGTEGAPMCWRWRWRQSQAWIFAGIGSGQLRRPKAHKIRERRSRGIPICRESE
jgi:hypothetical protein